MKKRKCEKEKQSRRDEEENEDGWRGKGEGTEKGR